MSRPVMGRRRYKNGAYQWAKIDRSLARRIYAFRVYGVSYGMPQLIHKGGKP